MDVELWSGIHGVQGIHGMHGIHGKPTSLYFKKGGKGVERVKSGSNKQKLVPSRNWYHARIGTKQELVPSRNWYQAEIGTKQELVPSKKLF